MSERERNEMPVNFLWESFRRYARSNDQSIDNEESQQK